MVAGGKRPGAGRPKSTPTKSIRVPTAGAAVARGLVEFYLEQAQKCLEASRWYQSAPVEAQKKITLKLESVEFMEMHEAGNLTFSCWEEMNVIVKAECPTSGESETFRLGARREVQG